MTHPRKPTYHSRFALKIHHEVRIISYSEYMDRKPTQTRAGYYLISLGSGFSAKLLGTNDERAFTVSQLQDMLGARSVLDQPDAHKRLSSHIDLLAFSLLPHSIQLVVFSISLGSASAFVNTLVRRLDEYRTQNSRIETNPFEKRAPLLSIRQLLGPHEALEASIKIHLDHSDWEYDRYSSIGFFLHDRRGNWMRVWRLSHLYDNEPENYYALLMRTISSRGTAEGRIATPERLVTSKRE